MSGLVEALMLRAVWNKGHTIPGMDPSVWRKDDFGNQIRFEDHGNRSSPYGWEKDHIIPQAIGGSDSILNLRPLQSPMNASLGGILSGLSR